MTHIVWNCLILPKWLLGPIQKKTFPSKPKKEMLEVIIIQICLACFLMVALLFFFALKVKIIACHDDVLFVRKTPKKMQKLRTLPKKTEKWNLKDEVPLFANPSFSETYVRFWRSIIKALNMIEEIQSAQNTSWHKFMNQAHPHTISSYISTTLQKSDFPKHRKF